MTHILLALLTLFVALPAAAESIFLDSNTESIEVTTSSTAPIAYQVSYRDSYAGRDLIKSSQGKISTATTTTIVAAPTATTQRRINWMTLTNESGASSNNVTLILDVSGTDYKLTPAITLGANQRMVIEDDGHFTIYDSAGIPLANGGGGGGGGMTELADDTSPTLGGNLDVAAFTISHVGHIYFEGPITHQPAVDTTTATSPTHVIHEEEKLWFNIDGQKQPVEGEGGAIAKTKTVGTETTYVNLSESEGYGEYRTVIGGGDTDLVGQEIDVFSTGGAQADGDEGTQGLRLYIQDYWLNATGTTAANLSSGAGTSTIAVNGMSEAMSKMVGENKLAIFTGSSVDVDLTDRPPGVVNTSGALDVGDATWSFDGSATGQGVWTLGSGQVTSSGVQSTGWCFSPVDSNYLDINGATASIWLPITAINSGTDTVTTRWQNQGYNGKTPYPMIASESTASKEAKVAPCAVLGPPTFTGGAGDFVADSLTFVKGAGFPAISSGATFYVYSYPGIRQIGYQFFFVNNLGKMYDSAGFRFINVIGGDAFEGRYQAGSAIDIAWTGGDLNTLKDGTHTAWATAINCAHYDAYGASCGVGLDFYYPPDPSDLSYNDWPIEIEWSSEDWTDDIDRVVIRTNNNSTHNLTLDKTDGWGQNGNYFLNQDNFNSVSEFSSVLGITGTPSSTTYLRGDGTWSAAGGSSTGIANVVDDPTPELGGNLDALDKTISNATKINNIFYADYNASGTTTAGIQEAIDACGSGSTTDDQGCIIVLPRGTFTITSTIEIGGATIATDMQNGITLQGHGTGYEGSLGDKLSGTTLVWGGANGGTMIQVYGMGHHLEKFTLDGGNEAGYGIKQLGNNGTGSVTGKNVYSFITVEDVLDTTNASTGWAFAFGVSDLGQNDHTVLDQVRMINNRHCLWQADGQAIQNVARQIDCTTSTVSPAIKIDRGGIQFQNLYLNVNAASAVGIQIDACATVFQWNEGSVEWDKDNGTVIKESDGGLGCGSGNRYARAVRDVRFQMQYTASTEHTCLDLSGRDAWTLEGNTWTSNSSAALRKCDLEFNNASATQEAYVTMLGNRSAWDSGADTTDIAITTASSGGGAMRVLRADNGRLEMIDSSGSFAIARNSTNPYVDLNNNGTYDGSDFYLSAASGGDSILVNTAGVTDVSGVDFTSGLGSKITLNAGASPDTATLELNYAQTLAGNPALNAEECVFTTDGTGGGGVLCEGSTGGNSNEQLHLFAAADGADTTDFIATNSAAVTDAIGATSTSTLTNKTLNAESTGNVLTTVEKVWFPAAGCNNVTPASFYDLPTTNAGAPACVTGTVQKGVLDFDATTEESSQVTQLLPSDLTGTMDAKFRWLANTTDNTKNVVWGLDTLCVADGEADDAAFANSSTVTDAAKSTANLANDATITGVTVTGCAAGEAMHVRIYRKAADASDTMTVDARLIGVELTYRRAQ